MSLLASCKRRNNYVNSFKRAAEGNSIFPRFYCDERFLQARRLMRGRAMLDLGYVLDDVLQTGEPLDYGALGRLETPFYAAVWRRGEGACLENISGRPRVQIEKVLHDTAHMPVIASGWKTSAHDVFDGWLVEHEVERLLREKGVTHVVHLSNRPLKRRDVPDGVGWKMVRKWLRVHDRELYRRVEERESARVDWREVEVCTLGLDDHRVTPQTRDRRVLIEAMGKAYLACAVRVGVAEPKIPAVWE